MSVYDKLTSPGPKKLLALDGGGIRALIAIEFLARIEALLRDHFSKPKLVLADYFDYIGGTSTGAIIASGLALGYEVAQVRSFYLDNAVAIFSPARFDQRLRHKFSGEKIRNVLQGIVGVDTWLGSDKIKTLLMLCMRNASTYTPWPVSNNPRAKYNDPSLAGCNLELPLWQLIRASTAAPIFFPPEVITVGDERFVFVDGGISVFNNPSFLLFRMATLEPYKVCWPVGQDNLLLISAGTGYGRSANANLDPGKMNLLYNVAAIPSALIYAASVEQDVLCRTFGRLYEGDDIDSEIGNLVGSIGDRKLFSYMRYNVELTRKGLDRLGLPDIDPLAVQPLDCVDRMNSLSEIGRRASKHVKLEHFSGFLDPLPS